MITTTGSPPGPGRAVRRFAVAAALALAFLAPLAGAEAAPSTAAPRPQLSIAIDNGQVSAQVGDVLRYTVTVKNLAAKAVDGLRVTQSLPPGVRLVSADSQGDGGKTQVRWRVDLSASGTASLATVVTVESPSPDLLRLAVVACAGTAQDDPVVCATHSDQLPAGAAAETAARPSDSSQPDDHRALWYLGSGALVLAGLGIGAMTVRRRSARAADRRLVRMH